MAYKHLWTPVVFVLRPNYESEEYRVEIWLGEMVVGAAEGDEVSQWVRINGLWLDRKETTKHSLILSANQPV